MGYINALSHITSRIAKVDYEPAQDYMLDTVPRAFIVDQDGIVLNCSHSR